MSNNKIGYVKLHRAMMENEMYFKDTFTRSAAWVDLLLLTNHKDGNALIRGNSIPVKKGQLAYAIKTLSGRWQWSQSKVDRYLKYLENEDQIQYSKNSFTTIITIKNWEKYQEEEIQTKIKRRSNEDQTKTNKNDKEYIKNIYINFLSLFISISGKNVKALSEKVKGQINARLDEGYTIKDFENAIKNCKADTYHIENPKYLTPEFITRPDKFEKYLNATPKKQTAESFFGV